MNIMTKMIESIDKLKSPIVAGIDTTYEMIPNAIRKKNFDQYGKTPDAISNMILDYNKGVIDNIHDLIPAIKIQIAMYEMYGIPGLVAYDETAKYAKEKGLIVIGDIKRGDIGSTAKAYASHLTGVNIEGNILNTWNEDMITINPYLGEDSLSPFTNACIDSGKACFILVKTSNPGSSDIQDLIINNPGSYDNQDLILNNPGSSHIQNSKADNEKNHVYEVVGQMVSKLGEKYIDHTGYSPIGAVVGATHKEIGGKLRKSMPNTFFLVPGYGAQGAKAEDLKDFFDKDGRGAIINSSRGIIANWQKDDKFGENNIGQAAREAVISMKDDLHKVL